MNIVTMCWVFFFPNREEAQGAFTSLVVSGVLRERLQLFDTDTPAPDGEVTEASVSDYKETAACLSRAQLSPGENTLTG